MTRWERKAKEYLRKHQLRLPDALWAGPALAGGPRARLDVAVVIPCYDEPELSSTLDSLFSARHGGVGVEVIVLINAPKGAPPSALALNQGLFESVRRWAETHSDIHSKIPAETPGEIPGDPRCRVSPFRVTIMHYRSLPPRDAGVGLARKLGMDHAVEAFRALNNPSGIIASLDADCRVQSNYFAALVEHFRDHPRALACSIGFEHQLEPIHCLRLREAVAQYELSVRYYRHGLRYAGSPYALHTVGSAMAVRAEAYVAQGGMNRRQAGEDFYFLQKFMALKACTELTETRVYPGVRLSQRTPFGTGRGVIRALDSGLMTYAPQVFDGLRGFLGRVPQIMDPVVPLEGVLQQMPASVRAFLTENGLERVRAEILSHTASRGAAQKRFHRWFNAFRTLKYVHFATSRYFPRLDVTDAAAQLFSRFDNEMTIHLRGGSRAEELLAHYRRLDQLAHPCHCGRDI